MNLGSPVVVRKTEKLGERERKAPFPSEGKGQDDEDEDFNSIDSNVAHLFRLAQINIMQVADRAEELHTRCHYANNNNYHY